MKAETNRTIVISGSTGYLGSAIARRLSQDGWTIAALCRDETAEPVTSLLSSLSGSGHRAYTCHLEDVADVQRTLDTIEKEQGGLYGCIHCAWSKPEKKELSRMSADQLLAYMDENVLISFNVLVTCATLLKEKKEGVLIGITTARVATSETTRIPGAYIPAKFALEGILKTLHDELAPFRVRVHSVAPDVMEGGMNEDMPKAFLDMIRAKNPSKSLIEPESVAEVISSLCSPRGKDERRLTIPVLPKER